MAKANFSQNRASDDPKRGRLNFSVEGLAAFLRSVHRFDTAYEAGQRLGVPAKTVRNWLDLICAPRGTTILRIASEYGPDALAAMYPRAVPDFLTSACREVEIEKLKSERAAIEARLRALETRGSNADAAGNNATNA